MLLLAASLALVAGGAQRGVVAAQQVSTGGQLTPLVVTATNASLGVLGSDGQEHLEYDLILTNVFTAPVTLSALDVMSSNGTVLLHLDGDALAANTQSFAFTVGGSTAPISEIPVGGMVATVIDSPCHRTKFHLESPTF
jgi:hypothetical protein